MSEQGGGSITLLTTQYWELAIIVIIIWTLKRVPFCGTKFQLDIFKQTNKRADHDKRGHLWSFLLASDDKN